MELRDIEYFAVIAGERHVGRAAERLGLSPPALSKSLRRLENMMQARLVTRTPKGVELTAAGESLLSHMNRLRLSLQDIAREISDVSLGRAGLLRVGVHPVLLDDLMTPACAELAADSPKIVMSVTVDTTDVIIPLVRRGNLDFALTTIALQAPDDLHHEHLFDDHVVVFAARAHRLAGRRTVSIADVVEEKWVMTALNVTPGWAWLHRAFEDSGLQPSRVAIRTNSLDLRNHLVAKSGFLGFISRRSLRLHGTRLGLVELRVDELTWTRRIGITCRKDAYLAPATLRMISMLRKRAQQVSRSDAG